MCRHDKRGQKKIDGVSVGFMLIEGRILVRWSQLCDDQYQPVDFLIWQPF